MIEEKNIWTNEVLESMDGAQKAIPDSRLLMKLHKKLFFDSMISMPTFLLNLAAIILLLLFNVLAIKSFTSQSESLNEIIVEEEAPFISQYQLYEI